MSIYALWCAYINTSKFNNIKGKKHNLFNSTNYIPFPSFTETFPL